MSFQEKAATAGKDSLNTLFMSVFKPLCSREITVCFASRSGQREYYRNEQICSSGMSLETENFLNGNLLRDDIDKDPVKVLKKIDEFQRISGNPHYFLAAADLCRYLARKAKPENVRISFRLSSLAYSYQFLAIRKKQRKSQDCTPLDQPLNFIAQIFNESVAGVFSHWKLLGFPEDQFFHLHGIKGTRFTLRKPEYHLSIPPDAVQDISLCSDYDFKGFLLHNRLPGIGVPLVAKIAPQNRYRSLKIPDGLTIPVTLLMRMEPTREGGFVLSPVLVDTSMTETLRNDETRFMPGSWTLSRDFTTPLACFLHALGERNLLTAMLNPVSQERNSGLYMVEPYQPGKIPVVFVHGLLSSPETWGQMLNSLRYDPEIRQRYQFWFYSYSTGIPVLHSANRLRKALLDAQNELCTTKEASENFEKMVIVGHSMGGLITRMLVQKDPFFLLEHASGESMERLRKRLSAADMKLLEENTVQPSLPFVHRAVFMAVPHRGAVMAQRALAQLGISLIKLPKDLQKLAESYKRILHILSPEMKLPDDNQFFTGISNLDPRSVLIRALSISAIRDDVTFHSIIGNQKTEDTPGGSDGIVSYESSHLDHAESEKIVRSGHSVHQKPAAIMELMRILLVHLHR